MEAEAAMSRSRKPRRPTRQPAKLEPALSRLAPLFIAEHLPGHTEGAAWRWIFDSEEGHQQFFEFVAQLPPAVIRPELDRLLADPRYGKPAHLVRLTNKFGHGSQVTLLAAEDVARMRADPDLRDHIEVIA
jgi:hypothetical protein